VSRRCFLVWVLVGLLGAAAPSVAAQMDGGQYRMAPGDIIQIRVFGEPDLSFSEIRLDDSGSFSYPFLGSVIALGQTAAELETRLKAGLDGQYLINPSVSVSVIRYREFFMNGEVRSPGGYAWQPGLTMRQAISMAGGLTERASQRRMSVIRGGDTERRPESVDMDSPVHPGDIIEIRQGLF
jgi:protein involved in polysaccharide export with SLBB domain